MADGDRDVAAAGEGGADRAAAIEGGVHPHQTGRQPGPRSAQQAAAWPASATSRFPPRGDPHDPFRSRWATITGALEAVATVASSAFNPRTLV